jgi:hypothetical protein
MQFDIEKVSAHRSQRSSRTLAASLEGTLLRLFWKARFHPWPVKRLVFLAVLLTGLAWIGLFKRPDQAPPQMLDETVAVAAPSSDAQPEKSDTRLDTSKFPPIDFEALRQRFGVADAETTTAWDNPRPPLVTRTMTFNKHRLKVVMLADGEAGASPPYKRWLLMGLLDPQTNEALSAEEIQKRLSAKPKPEKANARPASTQAGR